MVLLYNRVNVFSEINCVIRRKDIKTDMKELLFDVVTDDENKTERFGRLIAGILLDGDVVLLYGEMGAGKTAFVRGAAERIIPSCHVSSPTYGIVNEYKGDGMHIYHYDMYRVSSPEDLETTGFYERLGKDIVFAEWAEKIPEDELNMKHYVINFEKLSENSRKITVTRVRGDR